MIKRRLFALSLAITILASNIGFSPGIISSYARTQEEIDSDIEIAEANIEALEERIDQVVDAISNSHDVEERTALGKQKTALETEKTSLNKRIKELNSEPPTSDASGPGEVEEEIISVDTTTNPSDKGSVEISNKDLVVSEPIINSSKDSVRVTEIYSINNTIDDCYFKPKVNDVPLLANRVLKMGKYAAAYTGFFDLDNASASKPKGGTSRALEVLGYDYLLRNETYDTSTNKYSRLILNEEEISEETAIMNLYKALGLEMYDIKMTHKKASYTSGNSPAATLLNRSTIKYSGGGEDPLKSTDTMQAYETHVFVSRTNPELYMKKLSQDFNISTTSSKVSKLTNADFIIMATKMMQFYGEPEMSDNEMNQLIQVYGEDIPNGMDDELKQAWVYLKARGVLNISDLDLYSYMNKEDMFDILMRIKDKDSRVNYKDIQVTLSLNQDIIDQGYYPKDNLSIKQLTGVPITSTVDVEKMTYYDYLVPVSDYSRFKSQFGDVLNTMYISDNPTGIGSVLDGSSYGGIDNGMYYHYRIPIELNSSNVYNNEYVRVETPDNNDKPYAIYLQVGGGILRYENSMTENGTKIPMFNRRPFYDNEYSTYLDKNRVNKDEEFDWDSWNNNDNKNNDESTPDDMNLGFDEWMGPVLTQAPLFTWAKDDTNDKWRCYVEKGIDKEYLQSGVYYLGDETLITDNPQSNMFAFDSDGYMITGWYKEDNMWYYFNDSGNMYYSTTVNIEGKDYDFDQYGRWIDMKWNIPKDSEDIWSKYSNITGTWQLDNGKWWYMLPDGYWLVGGIYKVNNKFYSFNDDGYMVTGWQKDDDYWYYFDEEDGFMFINATTPDGHWCGQNGRAIGTWKLSLLNNKLYVMATNMFKPIVSFASNYNPADADTLTSTDNKRWYIHTIPKSLVNEDRDVVKSLIEDNGGTFSENGGYYSLRTQRSSANIMSKLTIKSDSGHELITNTSGILNLSSDDKYLVPYIDLLNAGLVAQAEISSDGKQVKLYAGTTEYGSNNESTFNGFGTIVLDNVNHTILVGTTIYRVPDDTTLFSYLKTDNNTSYQYVDSKGNLKTKTGDMLYVDFRAIFGWSADTTSFYRDSTGQVLLTVGVSREANSKKSVYSTIKSIGGDKYLKVSAVNGYSRPLLLMSNTYPVANWAMIRTSTTTGDSNNLVVSYRKEMFSDNIPNDLSKLKEILKSPSGTPVYENYCYRVFELDETGRGIETLTDTTVIEKGKFYFEKDFGIVYAAPTPDEWKDEIGYSKYLSGEFPLPITALNDFTWYEMSVPYIEGKDYGTNTLSDLSAYTTMKPQLSALSYLLYDKNEATTNMGSINSGSNFTDASFTYFGQNRIYSTSNGDYVIDGIKYGNTYAKIKKSNLKDSLYMETNRYYTRGKNANMSIGGGNSGTVIYVNVPEEADYEAYVDTGSVKEKPVLNNNGVYNGYNSYLEFKTKSIIKMIDESTSFITLFAMMVLPSVLFTLIMIVFLVALLADWKAVRMLCNKFIDPIWILTFGKRTVEDAHGMKFFVSVLTTATALALWANGNMFRILAFTLQFAGEIMNILRNI